MASAKPPLKHIPTTPAAPHSACATAAKARSHPVTRLVRSVSIANSRTTQARATDRRIAAAECASPARPTSDGR
nr:hypothetical protein [Amycolatopsis kentuckyensis]